MRLWIARHAPAIDTAICYGRTDIAVQIAPERAAESLLASYRGETPLRIWRAATLAYEEMTKAKPEAKKPAARKKPGRKKK
jgi:hypothetical protein